MCIIRSIWIKKIPNLMCKVTIILIRTGALPLFPDAYTTDTDTWLQCTMWRKTKYQRKQKNNQPDNANISCTQFKSHAMNDFDFGFVSIICSRTAVPHVQVPYFHISLACAYFHFTLYTFDEIRIIYFFLNDIDGWR